VDDSVRRPMRLAANTDTAPAAPFVRRARGHVPDPICLPGVAADAPPVLATGGWLKNTVCVTRGNEAFLSAHVGDLGSAACREALVASAERLCSFLGVRPQAVAHDLHPDFFSSHHALELAQRWRVPAVAVQHHHAHAAAVLAEHGVAGPALALVLDGTGLGTDGGAWGGELLRLDGAVFTRLGHLPELALPGGDRAAREPWRMGAAVLAAAGQGGQIARRYAQQPSAAALAGMLARGLNSPPTSSAGRLFDAAASLFGLVQVNGHEAEAAMRLEAAADVFSPLNRAAAEEDNPHSCRGVAAWPGAWAVDAAGQLHWPGLWQGLINAPCTDPAQQAQAAAEFHATLVAALADWALYHARRSGLTHIALAGGCFINRWLRHGLVCRLRAEGLQVLEACQAPPGDGGLSLGQAAVALAAMGAAPLNLTATTTDARPPAAPPSFLSTESPAPCASPCLPA
jgi:hydrogenase maturation protein HypF